MGLWIVTWDGPVAGERATQHWTDKANAEVHFARKAKAGLRPDLEGTDDIEEELASRRLLDQQH